MLRKIGPDERCTVQPGVMRIWQYCYEARLDQMAYPRGGAANGGTGCDIDGEDGCETDSWGKLPK